MTIAHMGIQSFQDLVRCTLFIVLISDIIVKDTDEKKPTQGAGARWLRVLSTLPEVLKGFASHPASQVVHNCL